MKITTQDSFLIIKILNKTGLKKDLMDFIKSTKALDKKKNDAYKKLQEVVLKDYPNYYSLGEEEKLKINEEMLEKHSDLQGEIEAVEEEKQEVLMNLLFSILEKIEVVEEDFYKLIAKIKGITTDEAKELDVVELFGTLTNIISDESVQKVFS